MPENDTSTITAARPANCLNLGTKKPKAIANSRIPVRYTSSAPGTQGGSICYGFRLDEVSYARENEQDAEADGGGIPGLETAISTY